INAIIGLFQEGKASSAFEKLRESQKRYATVIRNSEKRVILVEDVVKGDIVILESGGYVPADIRLISEKNLSINEAVLTGEWFSVSKNTEVIKKDVPVIKQLNMAWMGTFVSGGYGKGVVVEVGKDTQLGGIAESLSSIEEEETPIKKNIRNISKFLAILVLASIVIIFSIGVLRGESLADMLLVSIAVAVAIMPEGLPIAVTVVLAVGMGAILKKGGLVRNLLAAETLGSTTVILTDKTGTITEAKMRLKSIHTLQNLGGETNFNDGDIGEALKMGVLSSDAFVEEGNSDEQGKVSLVVRGRPLEKAIILAGLKFGFNQKDLFKKYKRLDLLAFDTKNKFAVSLNQNNDSALNRFFISGAPESLLERSSFVYRNGIKEVFSEKDKKSFIKKQEWLGGGGMRLIALGYKDTSVKKFEDGYLEDLKGGFVFVGLFAFEDPVREDVAESIQKAKEAGTKVIMLTGDNALTATKIAQEVGILSERGDVLTGVDIDKMSDKELLRRLGYVRVFARVLPEQKLRISRILKKSGEIVAMTGDGVNDAPALKGADIGIAVGNGTEVAKEASDMILLNNSFSVIVYAIEEGRRIIDNLKKIIAYLLSTSFSEIFLIGGALMFGLPLPILPTQILWANIVEEGLMNFAFVFEPAEKGVMHRKPNTHNFKNIITKSLIRMILIIGVVTGLLLIGLYFWLLDFGLHIDKIRTLMFVAVSVDSIFFSISLKNFHKPFWKIDVFSNMYLVYSLLGSFTLLILAIFFIPLQKLLSLTPLGGFEILVLAGIGIFNLTLIEITKHFIFCRKGC
ncbi:cation-translocating P-type ATPase, partial [Patescibacteria group bacterium]